MKRIIKFFPVAVAAFALASCSNDNLFGFGESTDIANADGSIINAELVEDGVTRMGVAAGGAGYIWTEDDQLNVYSLNSLKFNTYNIKAGAGTKSATFQVVNDNLGLGTTITDGSEMFGITNDKNEKYIYSFRANEDNEPILTMEMPAQFTQNDGATAGALPMPFYSKGITVNAAGGLSMKYNKLAGLLALDLVDLPLGTKAIEIYSKDAKLAGMFLANLSDDAPYLAASEEFTSTYNDAIRVDFDAALAAIGPRMIYIPVPVGTYTNFKIASIQSDATDGIIRPAYKADGTLRTAGDNAGFAATEIFKSTSYKVELKAQTITSAVEVDGAAFASWNDVSQALVNNMDGTHSVIINNLDPAANFTAGDDVFYIPVNESMAKSNVVINFTNSLKEKVTIKEGVATIAAGLITGWTEATTLGSASAAAVKSVTLNLFGVNGAGDKDVDAYLPTSEFIVGSTGAAYAGTISAITATEGLFVATENAIAAVTTFPANTGNITVETGTVTTLTPTAGDGLITVKGTVTNLTANILGLTKGIVIGATGDAGTIVYSKAAPAANETPSSGDIILQDGGKFTALTNNGSGNVILGQVGANATTVTNYGGSLTIGSVDMNKQADVQIGAVTQYGTGEVTLQNTGNLLGLTGIASLTVDSKSDVNVTLKNVIIEGALTAGGATNHKAVNVEATDAVVGSLDYDNAGTSRFNAYGYTALAGGVDEVSAISDANEVLNFYSYYAKGVKGVLPVGTNNTKWQYLYTAGQLANLATAQNGYMYKIDPRVKQIELAGVDVTHPVIWAGSTIPTGIGFTLDCNNVALKNLKLDNGTGNGNIGLIAATTDAAITITNVKLSTVQYTERTKADQNVGILVGNAGAAVTISNVNIDGLNINSSLKNQNVGGLVGYAKGAATITNVVLAGNNIVSGGANVGGLIGYAEAAPSIDQFTLSVKNLKGTENVGGVVGYAEAGATKIDKITATISTVLQGTYNVGGVVGYHHGGALSIGGNNSTVTIASLAGNYNLGGTIGSTNAGNVTISKTKANVTAFATDGLSEDANLAGTVAMAIGYINGVGQNIDLDKDCKPTKFLNLKASEKQALKYDKRRYQDLNGWNKFWNGNPYVGYVNGTVGFIKVPNKNANGQETLVNSVNYNVWVGEDEAYGDDAAW